MKAPILAASNQNVADFLTKCTTAAQTLCRIAQTGKAASWFNPLSQARIHAAAVANRTANKACSVALLAGQSNFLLSSDCGSGDRVAIFQDPFRRSDRAVLAFRASSFSSGAASEAAVVFNPGALCPLKLVVRVWRPGRRRLRSHWASLAGAGAPSISNRLCPTSCFRREPCG